MSLIESRISAIDLGSLAELDNSDEISRSQFVELPAQPTTDEVDELQERLVIAAELDGGLPQSEADYNERHSVAQKTAERTLFNIGRAAVTFGDLKTAHNTIYSLRRNWSLSSQRDAFRLWRLYREAKPTIK